MNRTQLAGVLSLALILSACVTPAPKTPPVEPTFTSAAERQKVNKFVVLPSRTYAFTTGGKRVEKEGIPCRIKGTGFSVNYRTPANVRLPVYGLDTSELSMTCEYEGSTKFENLRVENLTAERIANSGNSGGFLGVIIAASISSARGNQPDDDYTYERPDMELNRRPSS